MGDTQIDNSPVWFPVIEAIQLANWCDAAAVALVCYDSVLMFPREVEYIWRKRWSYMSAFYVIVRYLGIALALGFWASYLCCHHSTSTYFYHHGDNGERICTLLNHSCVAVDRFVNFGAFVDAIVGNVIMSMRIYAMYLGSRIVLFILVAMMLARIAVGLAVAVVIFGPNSGINATEWILSGIYVCGPSVSTASSLPFAWNILGIIVNTLLFLLAAGRFTKHVIDMRRTLQTWKVSDLMKVLVRDSIVYFFLNLLSTILLMISIWGVPTNWVYFAIVTAYTQNGASVLIPRLVISFRESYEKDGEPSQHVGDVARQTVGSEQMVFQRRTTVSEDVEVELRRADQEWDLAGTPGGV